MSTNDKFLQLENIDKTFYLGNGKEYNAVVDVNLNIKKNEIISIIGHSGCGKSTLLNMIAGLDMQTKGHIILKNKEITGPGPERAVVFQNHSLLPWLTVYQNIEMAVKKVMPELNSNELKQRVLHFVSMVNLDHAKDKYPSGISGGMKQRVGIARALSIKPDVLLMDDGKLEVKVLEVNGKDIKTKAVLNGILKYKDIKLAKLGNDLFMSVLPTPPLLFCVT